LPVQVIKGICQQSTNSRSCTSIHQQICSPAAKRENCQFKIMFSSCQTQKLIAL
jgi:hypothetical protein